MNTIDDSEIPHLSSDLIANAVPFLERKARGRPRGSNKSMVSLRIDSDVYAWLKSSGPGYQSKLNIILRQMYELNQGGRI
jgi:uncharacterized protein (DUF4415 family)